MSTQSSCTGGGDDNGGPPPRDVVLAWFKDRVLQRLGLQRPPAPPPPPPSPPDGEEDAAAGRPGVRPQRHVRSSRVDLVDQHQHRQYHHHHQQQQQQQQTSQIIVFPSADSHPDSEDISSSSSSSSSCFTYYFQPSLSSQESSVTSAHFWFYAGEGMAAAPPNSSSSSSSSASLFILTAGQRLLRAAEAPSLIAPDGWLTYHLGPEVRAPVSEGPFVLQVRCAACECRRANESSDKLPFLHLHAGPRDEGGGGSPDSRRRSAGPIGPTIPWSPSAVDLLQRPSQDVPRRADCVREDVEISFEELGWDNWIVHPKAVTFQYCRGNCSAWDRATTVLGIKQCCAPAPGTMRSLRVTTTSDGGYSLSYETLPNIIAEECACV